MNSLRRSRLRNRQQVVCSTNKNSKYFVSLDAAVSQDVRAKGYVFSFDLMRFVAIAMIVIAHAAEQYLSPSETLLMQCLVCGNAVLFFMVSGALLCPAKGDYARFVVKHVKRVGIPFLVWSVIYLGLDYFVGGCSWEALTRDILELPVLAPFPSGWFIYVIIGIYLVAPIISVWIENASRRWIEYFLLLWIISAFAPYAAIFADFDVSNTFAGQFAGYLGYWILGYYLYRYPLRERSRRFRIAVWSVLLLFAIVYTVRWYFFTVKYDLTSVLYNDMSVNVVAWSAIVFLLLLKAKGGNTLLHRFVNRVARLSFGVFLCHDAVIKYAVAPYFGDFSGAWILSGVAALVLSLLLTEVLYRLPFRKHLV